ncbi:DUF4132 domain-containing protein [Micromonospora sp. SH-82]|uniref:DUF4132 domain-containing protein n=1 Tax=Micromonospora sp. SH-82 TaxID=3132938 RepID=UPI003EB861EC
MGVRVDGGAAGPGRVRPVAHGVVVDDLPDEEAFTVPAAWQRSALPRRDRPLGPPPASTAGTVADDGVPSRCRRRLQQVLDHPDSDPTLVAEARGQLGGEPSDLGAAAVLTAVLHVESGRGPEGVRAVVDDWSTRYGAALVAAAVTYLSELRVEGNGPDTYRLSWRPGDQDEGHAAWDSRLVVLERVREHLAHLDDVSYAEAVAALDALREGGGPRLRTTTCFLLPTRLDWVDAECAALPAAPDPRHARLLWCAASTPDHARVAAAHLPGWGITHDIRLVHTAVVGVGPAVAEFLVDRIGEDHPRPDVRRRTIDVVAVLPTDAALRGLVDRLDQTHVHAAVATALSRFPVRGVRVLAAAATTGGAVAPAARTLLGGLVSTCPAAVAVALPALPAPARTQVEQVLADRAATPPEATPDLLPAVLVAPPWSAGRRPRTPPVVTGLTRAEETDLVWLPDEWEQWSALRPCGHFGAPTDRNLPYVATLFATGNLPADRQLAFLLRAPADLAAPLLHTWRPEDPGALRSWICPDPPVDWLRILLVRHGPAAVAAVRRLARADPSLAPALLPVADAGVADQMADWFSRLPSVRQVARAWLDRHPVVAARALLPAALGRPGRARRSAEAALLAVATARREVVLTEAARYGAPALHAARTLLDSDPLDVLPVKPPNLPEWVDPAVLPPVLVRGRRAVLPAESVRHLCTMLAVSRPDEEYSGLAQVRAACDPTSLAEFGWALLQRWRADGSPPRQGWILTGLALVGDDETARRLAPVIRAWPGEGGHARAVTGLDVLAGLGSDVALVHLHRIAQTAPYRGLRAHAADRVAAVARRLGLTPDQLADRFVPDLGLDADATVVLDYGPRRFTVGFDEQLTPYVLDEQGGRRRDLPRPGPRDDAVRAPQAYRRFTGLKKDVRTLAATQLDRFETAMVRRRRLPVVDFRRYLLDHPLVGRLVRRLVWTSVDGDGEPVTAFRVTEAGTFATVHGAACDLPDEASVGVAHPLHLGATASEWAQVLADHAVVQPFPQVDREVYTLSAAERAGPTLRRFTDATAETARLLGLQRRGWRRGEAEDAGVQQWLEYELPDGRAVVVNLNPGIVAPSVADVPDQRIEGVWLNDGPTGRWRPQGLLPFTDLDPVTTSEVLRDLTGVVR